jgi:hypothetical protein
MTIPGINLLNIASQVINLATVTYYQYVGRTINSVGQYIADFSEPTQVKGSLQAVPRGLYEKQGLDFNKKYVVFYVPQNTIEVQRDVTGDQFTYSGQRYQVESSTDWFFQDGWKGLIASYFKDE